MLFVYQIRTNKANKKILKVVLFKFQHKHFKHQNLRLLATQNKYFIVTSSSLFSEKQSGNWKIFKYYQPDVEIKSDVAVILTVCLAQIIFVQKINKYCHPYYDQSDHWRLFIHRICRMRLIIPVMIINTGQMCAVNYSDRPRMCDLNCPSWKKYGVLQRKKWLGKIRVKR